METLLTELTPTLRWVLLSTAKASVVICLILAVRVLLRDRLPSRWWYVLWVVVLIRLLCPWTPQSRWSVFNLWSVSHDKVRSAPAVLAPETGETPSPVSPGEMPPVAEVSRPEGIPEPKQENVTAKKRHKAEILSLVWLIGAVIVAALALVCDIRLWRWVRTQRNVTDGEVLELFEDCKGEMGVHTVVGLLLTDQVTSPCLFGVLRPRLLLPLGTLESLNREQLRHVFLHEFAHLKRFDNLWGWLMLAIQVLHWFNPLIWLSLYRMRTDRELACDDLVLAAMEEGEESNYGTTIMDLSSGLARLHFIPSMTGIVENRSLLKRRIEMIAQYRPYKNKSFAWAALLLTLFALFTLTDAHTAVRARNGAVNNLSDVMFQNLLLYYSFDKDGGIRAVDVSGMDFHGRIINADYVTDGMHGGALAFNGKDSQIVLDEMKLKAFSFAAWVKTDTDNMNKRVLFQLYNGEKSYSIQGAAFTPMDVYLSYDQSLPDDGLPWTREDMLQVGQWIHIAVTYDGESAILYRNGQPFPLGSAPRSSYSKGPVYIGGADAWDGDSGGFWQGALDEVALFNRALSEAEVSLLYRLIQPTALDIQKGITIEALIDDTSELWIYPHRMIWHNLRDAKPGRIGGRKEPTWINGQAWIPTWYESDIDGGPDMSEPFALDIGTLDLTAELVAVGENRAETRIDRDAEVRTYKRDGAFVIRFEDVLAGPAWFRVRLSRQRGQTEKVLDGEYPYQIDFKTYTPSWLDRSGPAFRQGDWITIDRILSTSPTLQVGQEFKVSGRYQLSSASQASLHLYATNGETRCKQGPIVKRGTGRYTRTFSYLEPGQLHLSYYPAGGGGSFGDLYFRQLETDQIRAAYDKEFPYPINFEIFTPPYQKSFREGDGISIDRIHGTAPTLTTGQRYLIMGRYRLSSVERADLCLYAANGETNSDQGPPVERGSGRYTRIFEYLEPGVLHLSYYPTGGGRNFGDIYFRQREGISTDWSTQANLTLTDLELLHSTQEGQYLVSATIRNTSDFSVGSFTISFHCNDPDRENPRIRHGGPLQPGQGWQENMRLDLKELQEGQNTIEVVIDAKDEIKESMEGDNARVYTIAVWDEEAGLR